MESLPTTHSRTRRSLKVTTGDTERETRGEGLVWRTVLERKQNQKKTKRMGKIVENVHGLLPFQLVVILVVG